MMETVWMGLKQRREKKRTCFHGNHSWKSHGGGYIDIDIDIERYTAKQGCLWFLGTAPCRKDGV